MRATDERVVPGCAPRSEIELEGPTDELPTGAWDTDDRAVLGCVPRSETELEGVTDLLPKSQLALKRTQRSPRLTDWRMTGSHSRHALDPQAQDTSSPKVEFVDTRLRCHW